jgi:hypothetical protein
LANASLNAELITRSQRNDFIEGVLKQVPSTFKFDSDSKVISVLSLVLDKAKEDGIIDLLTRRELEEQYTKQNVFADPRFLALKGLVEKHCEQLSDLESYARKIDERVRRRSNTRAVVGVVCALIPIFGGIIGHLAGELTSKAVEKALESIVDFSDAEYVKDFINKCVDEQVSDMVKEWTNELLQKVVQRQANTKIVPLVAVRQVSLLLSGRSLDFSMDRESFCDILKSNRLRLSRHQQTLEEHGIDTVKDLKLLDREAAENVIGMTLGELNRLCDWQKSVKWGIRSSSRPSSPDSWSC